jgi:hypothetical protein
MGRKPRVDRTPEEKWQIVQEGIKSGNVSETCRRYEIAPNLFYRWKDEAELVPTSRTMLSRIPDFSSSSNAWISSGLAIGILLCDSALSHEAMR